MCRSAPLLLLADLILNFFPFFRRSSFENFVRIISKTMSTLVKLVKMLQKKGLCSQLQRRIFVFAHFLISVHEPYGIHRFTAVHNELWVTGFVFHPSSTRSNSIGV